MIVGAIILTITAQNLQTSWRETNIAVMSVDAVLWVGLLYLMFHRNRYWLIWMAAAQTLTVATHLATAVAAVFDQKIYAGLGTVWAIPCLLVMARGIALDRRAERMEPISSTM
jgi:hypothetical protein